MMKKIFVIICVFLMLMLSVTASANAQEQNQPFPGGPIAQGGPPISQWEQLVFCESTNNPNAISPGGTYRGLFQFDFRTWGSVGGVGDPAFASPAEQWYRAFLLYQSRNRQPWPNCGRYLNGAPIINVIPQGGQLLAPIEVAPVITPIGNSDLVWTISGTQAIRAAGWCKLDNSLEKPEVHIYVDGVLTRATTPTLPRPDVDENRNGWEIAMLAEPGAHFIQIWCTYNNVNINLGEWHVSVPDTNGNIIGVRNG